MVPSALNPNPWGRTLYVNSAHPRASDVGHSGLDPPQPLQTLQRGVLNAQAGDLIIVGPGHTETVGELDYIDFNLADLTVRGIGNGDRRPKFSFTGGNLIHQTVTAAGLTIENLHYEAASEDVAVGIDFQAPDGVVRDLFVTHSGVAGDIFAVCILMSNAAHRCHVIGVQARQPASNPGPCVSSTGPNDIRIEGCDLTGNYLVGGIANGTGATGHVVVNNLVENVRAAVPCIKMSNTTTGRMAGNRCRLANDGGSNWIVAAAMDWFQNYGVNDNGETGKLIGTPSA